MPNYITNIVNMKGIANKPIYDENDNFDFNTLIPMNEELNLDSGGIEDLAIRECLRYVLNSVGRYSSNIIRPMYKNMIEVLNQTEEGDHVSITDYIKYNKNSSREKIINLGLQYIQNVVKYGYSAWYDWCINNWGTKWNAMDTQIRCDDEISFLTAWSPPDPIYLKLSEMYPYDEIHVTWVDEGDLNIYKETYLDGDKIEESHTGLIERSDPESTENNIKHIKEYCDIRGFEPTIEDIEDTLAYIRKKDPIRLIEKIEETDNV